MKSLFENNAYKVLGLETSTSQKDAARRSKEIEKLIQIDETITYGTDVPLLDNARSESDVKEAYQKLTSPNKRIAEFFFWFQLSGLEDEQAFAELVAGNNDASIQAWSQLSERNTARGWIARKNLALVHTLLLWKSGEQEHLGQSVTLWHEIISSDSFWTNFSKIYALHDEFGTSDTAISSFRLEATALLADFYAATTAQYNDNEYVLAFSLTFRTKGAKIQKDLVDPVFESIHDLNTQLLATKINSDEELTTAKLSEIKKLIKKIQNDFEKLRDVGFYEDSETKSMRDSAAEAIRSVSVDLYNNLNESSKSLSLLKVALEICGTPGTQRRIKQEMATLKSKMATEKIAKPINDLIDADKYSDALNLLDEKRATVSNDTVLQHYFENRTKLCVTAIGLEQLAAAKKLFDEDKFSLAKQRFLSLKTFVMSYISYFSFDNDGLNQVLAEAEQVAARLKETGVDSIDTYRTRIISNAEEWFGENFEHSILIILVDATLWASVSEQLPSIKRRNTVRRGWRTIGGWVGGFIVVSVLGGIFHSSGSDTSGAGSGGSTAYQTCASEADSLKSQISTIDAQMAADKSAGNTYAYNANVPQENSLVDQYNTKAHECNGLR